MAEDPYKTLGVARDASAGDVRRAYRKLAKQHHPDLNPGNKEAEERFKAASAANEILGDPDKRARFDRGEIDASGQERPPQPPPGWRSYAEAGPGARYSRGGGAPFDGEEMGEFADLFGMFGARGAGMGGGTGPGAGRGADTRMRGRDQRYSLTVDFLDAVRGATRRLTLPDGRTLDVGVPPGTEGGQTLRLRGQGDAGWNGGPDGDALIRIEVAEHPFFRRDGRDIRLDLPVSLREAVLGAKVSVPTPGGTVTLSVPAGSDTGRQLRLRGRGVPARGGEEAGDLYATLRVVLGPPDPALQEFLRGAPDTGFDPRRELTEATR